MNPIDVRQPHKHTTVVAARLLIGVGAALLLLGALWAYPYFATRLAPESAVTGALPAAPATTPVTAHATPPLTPTSSVSGFTFDASYLTFEAPPTALPAAPPAIPTRIVIPTIGVDAPVVATSWHTVEVDGEVQVTWDVPAEYAAGWHETSAPLGVSGNTVLNGHNTGHGEVFRDLYTLEPGAPIIVYAGETPHSYIVSATLILREAGQPLEVRQANARAILPTTVEQLTLVTCHPYGSLRDRLIVIAYPEAAQSEGSTPGSVGSEEQ